MSNPQKIIVLGISGSPRAGSTDFIVKDALNHAQTKFEGVETEYFSAKGKTINFCIHCDYCLREKKGCVHKDDMNELYPLMTKANAFVIGSPVYQNNISGQLKTILDRTRALVAANPKVFQNKLGMAIAVGGDRIGGQESTIHAILDFYILNGIIAVSGGFFGANLGGTIWSKDKGAQGAKEDLEGVRSVHKSVNKLIKLAKKIL